MFTATPNFFVFVAAEHLKPVLISLVSITPLWGYPRGS